MHKQQWQPCFGTLRTLCWRMSSAFAIPRHHGGSLGWTPFAPRTIDALCSHQWSLFLLDLCSSTRCQGRTAVVYQGLSSHVALTFAFTWRCRMCLARKWSEDAYSTCHPSSSTSSLNAWEGIVASPEWCNGATTCHIGHIPIAISHHGRFFVATIRQPICWRILQILFSLCSVLALRLFPWNQGIDSSPHVVFLSRWIGSRGRQHWNHS